MWITFGLVGLNTKISACFANRLLDVAIELLQQKEQPGESNFTTWENYIIGA